MTVDLGYMHNRGITIHQNVYNDTLADDTFAIGATIEMSDSEALQPDSVHDLLFSVKFGNVVVVSKFHYFVVNVIQVDYW